MNVVLLPDPVIAAPAIPSDALFEIIDGQVVELPPMSFFANVVASRLANRIDRFAADANLGFAINEGLFKLALPVDRQRRPDVAFVSRDRWPAEKGIPTEGSALPVTPDLMVEVVSPTDYADEVQEKMQEYFRAGAVQVWIIYPRHGTFELFDSPTSSRWLTREGVVENIPFLPGFRLALSELFPPVAAA